MVTNVPLWDYSSITSSYMYVYMDAVIRLPVGVHVVVFRQVATAIRYISVEL